MKNLIIISVLFLSSFTLQAETVPSKINTYKAYSIEVVSILQAYNMALSENSNVLSNSMFIEYQSKLSTAFTQAKKHGVSGVYLVKLQGKNK